MEKIAEALDLNFFTFEFEDKYPSNYLENYLQDTGYKIEYDEDNAEIFLLTDTDEWYEITQDDINDIRNSTKSFIKFKLSEIIKKSRKINHSRIMRIPDIQPNKEDKK